MDVGTHLVGIIVQKITQSTGVYTGLVNQMARVLHRDIFRFRLLNSSVSHTVTHNSTTTCRVNRS